SFLYATVHVKLDHGALVRAVRGLGCIKAHSQPGLQSCRTQSLPQDQQAARHGSQEWRRQNRSLFTRPLQRRIEDAAPRAYLAKAPAEMIVMTTVNSTPPRRTTTHRIVQPDS
ncbi:hypothetical protein JI435_120890, partial [Parastagonospora nodorum SN15]